MWNYSSCTVICRHVGLSVAPDVVRLHRNRAWFVGTLNGFLPDNGKGVRWPVQLPDASCVLWPVFALRHLLCGTGNQQVRCFHLPVPDELHTWFVSRKHWCEVCTSFWASIWPAKMCIWGPLLMTKPRHYPFYQGGQMFYEGPFSTFRWEKRRRARILIQTTGRRCKSLRRIAVYPVS